MKLRLTDAEISLIYAALAEYRPYSRTKEETALIKRIEKIVNKKND